MFTVAVLLLVLYLVASLVFRDWKRHVNYPKQSVAVGITTGAFEIAAVLLACLALR